MPTRRQEKVNRIIREVVADAIQNRLSDPRLEEAMISVTQVDVAPDLRTADVLISIMSQDQKAAARAFEAVQSASRRIRTLLRDKLTTRFVPELRFHEDKKLKSTMETLKVIEQATRELQERQQAEENDQEDSQ